MKSLTLATTALLGISAATVNAQIVYNNLMNPFDQTFGYESISDEGPLYDSFLVGPVATKFVGFNIDLDLQTRDEGAFYVGLYSDAGLKPGALIEESLVSDVGLWPGRLHLELQPQMLSANTEYWIGLSQDASNPTKSVGWDFGGNSNEDTGVQGQFWADYSGVHPNGDDLNSPFMMGPLPEPAPFAALGLGVLGVLLRRRRR